MTAKAPALTTATACSRAVTGVGATLAAGSQSWKGKMAALTPKPRKPSTNMGRSSSIGAFWSAGMPPATKLELPVKCITVASARKAIAAPPSE